MKNRVLFIHHGGDKGGAPRSLSFLIQELDKDNFDATVLVKNSFNNIDLYSDLGATVVKRNIGPWHGSVVAPLTFRTLIHNLLDLIPTYLCVKKIVNKVDPDIVHLNSTCLCFVAKSIKKSFPNIPIVCHVREPIQEGFWGDILRRNCNKYVDRFIAIDEYDAKSLNTTKPVDIIYNFVDFNIYNQNVKSNCLRQELNLLETDKILLYLARICPQNGAKEMLENILPLLKRRSDIHLCIVGVNYAEKSDYLLEIIKIADTMENVHLLEFRNDVPQVIKSSDIMIVPFQEPHFARSVIEAAAMGIPSIASNIEGVNELIVDGKTGFLFDYTTFDKFNYICECLIDDTELYESFSQNAVRHAMENFNSKINSRRTIHIYEQILNKE